MVSTLLLTRPQENAETFAKAAEWVGDVVISPLIEIVLRPFTPPLPGEGVIFTSQRGVHAMQAVTDARDASVWCVGPGTQAAARAAGFEHVHQGAGTAEALIAALRAAPPSCPLVHLHGAHVVTDLAGRLSDAGLCARGVVAYDQFERPLTDAACRCLQTEGNVVLPLFSPRSARLFANAWRGLPVRQARLHVLAISDAAARGLEGVPLASLHVAATPDLPGMLARLKQVQAMLEPDQNPR